MECKWKVRKRCFLQQKVIKHILSEYNLYVTIQISCCGRKSLKMQLALGLFSWVEKGAFRLWENLLLLQPKRSFPYQRYRAEAHKNTRYIKDQCILHSNNYSNTRKRKWVHWGTNLWIPLWVQNSIRPSTTATIRQNRYCCTSCPGGKLSAYIR